MQPHFCLVSFNFKASTQDEHKRERLADIVHRVSGGLPAIVALQEVTQAIGHTPERTSPLRSVVNLLNEKSRLEHATSTSRWDYNAGYGLHKVERATDSNGVSWLYRDDIFEHINSWPVLGLNGALNRVEKTVDSASVQQQDWKSGINRLLCVTPYIGFFRHRHTGEVLAILNIQTSFIMYQSVI